MTREDLLGSWDLASFTIEKDGAVREWGKSARGLLIYTEEGTMSVSINAKQTGTDCESRFQSILFYAGTYEFKAPNTVVHRVSQASDPERIGKDMVRTGTLEGRVLTLAGKGDGWAATVIWRRR